ncbi:hypothetical protein D3C86_1910570 [compost metagenome]
MFHKVVEENEFDSLVFQDFVSVGEVGNIIGKNDIGFVGKDFFDIVFLFVSDVQDFIFID